MTTAKIPEILAPAGNREKCATALLYGADAVFLGGLTNNLRAAAQGFGQDDLVFAVQEARKYKARINYCLNSLPLPRDMPLLPAQIEQAAEAGVNAFIVADPGIFRLVQRYAPKTAIHISTQMNTTNAEALAFWHGLGAKRVNLARELTSRDIHALCNEVARTMPDLELEVFTHGAMCLAVSGQCLLSAWVNERSANQGRCTQPCRFEYKAMPPDLPPPSSPCRMASPDCTAEAEILVEERIRSQEAHAAATTGEIQTATDQSPPPLWGVRAGGSHGEQGYSSLWATDDLCLLPFLPWLAGHGIAACKIEGRMKGAAYVAHVTDVYKTAMNAIAAKAPFGYKDYLPELFATASRNLTTGFFLPHTRRCLSLEAGAKRVAGRGPGLHTLAARVSGPDNTDGTAFIVEIRGQWQAASTMEAMLPGLARPRVQPSFYSIESLQGASLSVVNPGQRVRLVFHGQPLPLREGIFIRTVLE